MKREYKTRKDYIAPETEIIIAHLTPMLDNKSGNPPKNDDGVAGTGGDGDEDIDLGAKHGVFTTDWDNDMDDWNDCNLWN